MAFGENSLRDLAIGSNNTSVGYNSISSGIDLSNNTAIGSSTLSSLTFTTPDPIIDGSFGAGEWKGREVPVAFNNSVALLRVPKKAP